MTEQPTPPIDPRFDPLFQRGYADSPTHTADERWGLGAVASLAGAGAAAGARAGAGAGAAAAVAVSSATAASDELPGQRSDRDERDDRAPWPARRPTMWSNPFLYVLGGVSVALVVGGIWLFVWAVGTPLNNGGLSQVPIEAVLLQMVWNVSPAMVSAGLIGIVAFFACLTLMWRKSEHDPALRQPSQVESPRS